MRFWPKNLGSQTETANPPGCEGNLETACPTWKIHTLETAIETLETANTGCEGNLETASVSFSPVCLSPPCIAIIPATLPIAMHFSVIALHTHQP